MPKLCDYLGPFEAFRRRENIRNKANCVSSEPGTLTLCGKEIYIYTHSLNIYIYINVIMCVYVYIYVQLSLVFMMFTCSTFEHVILSSAMSPALVGSWWSSGDGLCHRCRPFRVLPWDKPRSAVIVVYFLGITYSYPIHIPFISQSLQSLPILDG